MRELKKGFIFTPLDSKPCEGFIIQGGEYLTVKTCREEIEFKIA